MATALSIINDALKEIGVLAAIEAANSTMADDAFRALNRLCNLWSNEPAFAYVNTAISIALTGQASFTVGPTGNLVANRPILVDSAYLVRDGITYPVEVVDYTIWDSIAYKATTGGNAYIIYYEPALPDGIVNVWPLSTGCTLYLRTTDLVTSFPDLSTDVTLAPGYEEYFIKSLAVDRAPSFGREASKSTTRAAINAMKTIKKTNTSIPLLQIDPTLTRGGRGSLGRFLGGY